MAAKRLPQAKLPVVDPLDIWTAGRLSVLQELLGTRSDSERNDLPPPIPARYVIAQMAQDEWVKIQDRSPWKGLAIGREVVKLTPPGRDRIIHLTAPIPDSHSVGLDLPDLAECFSKWNPLIEVGVMPYTPRGTLPSQAVVSDKPVSSYVAVTAMVLAQLRGWYVELGEISEDGSGKVTWGLASQMIAVRSSVSAMVLARCRDDQFRDWVRPQLECHTLVGIVERIACTSTDLRIMGPMVSVLIASWLRGRMDHLSSKRDRKAAILAEVGAAVGQFERQNDVLCSGIVHGECRENWRYEVLFDLEGSTLPVVVASPVRKRARKQGADQPTSET